MNPIRNRVVEHVTVKARDLVPHPLNFREHPRAQRRALAASFEEIGFARSLLGYRRADGKVQLIDGHLRAELHPDLDVVVELLDVSDEEAGKLLLTLDPLAALAGTNAETARRLTATVRTASAALQQLWDGLAGAADATQKRLEAVRPPEEKFLILIECQDEADQTAKLQLLERNGIPCRALVS
jgi:hypothetical protein